MPFAATWMNIEIMIPIEVSQTEEDKHYMTHSYVEFNFKKWYKWTYLQNKNRPTDIENKVMVTKVKSGEGMGIN